MGWAGFSWALLREQKASTRDTRALLDYLASALPLPVPALKELMHKLFSDHMEMEIELPTELIHRIQMCMSEKHAGGTCILSKSWLHAWYTIPHLRFHKNKLINNTFERYHRHNLPIQTLDIRFDDENKNTARLLKRWIPQVASKSFLKELSLSFNTNIYMDWSTVIDSIFSCENLTRISVTKEERGFSDTFNLRRINTMIKCVSLRVLVLQRVSITEEVFNSLVSTCMLLEKIQLWCCNGFKTLKVKDLPCLMELEIETWKEDLILEIDNVPSLVFFHYWKYIGESALEKPVSFNMHQIVSVRQLHIYNLGKDSIAEFFNMIKSKLIFLEELNVEFVYQSLDITSFVIASTSLKRLTLNVSNNMPNDIQIDAPKLLYFCYESHFIPTLSFPFVTPKKIELNFKLQTLVDLSFFLRMREVLNLSSTFDIYITGSMGDALAVLSNTDYNDLRKRGLFPATNVQKLHIQTFEDVRKHTQCYDYFFLICHPSHFKAKVGAIKDNNNRLFSVLTEKGIMNKNVEVLGDLTKVQLQNPCNGRWEDLTLTSWKTFIDPLSPYSYVDFKLEWFNP
ncbi:uncharacterized protein [Rutidosis leptorrhynchoides]|uniref:uncharacterized protein n=1 Tax=Rutidosis leptorrhynchoides TaxID=125765 RepID=UPI003A9963FE